MVSYFNFSLFDNIPYRRLKKSVFQLGGLKTKYLRFYSVLPNMKKGEFEKHMQKVRKFARSIKWIKIHTNILESDFSYNVFVTTDTKQLKSALKVL